MELHQLEYFVAVADEGNFTRAAERVHISQSGVSAQVRRLEDQLGTALIDRSGRRATLTPAGAAALPHARAALASVDAMRRAVDDVTGLITGRLVVGMVVGCRVAPLFDALAAFHANHNGVELALFEDNSDRLVERVRTGDTDLALVAAAGALPAGLQGFTIVRDRLVAAVPLDHPMARRRRATLPEISAYPIVCLPVGTGIRTVFDQACAVSGVRPKVALEASAPDSVADLAARGLGVGVLSESTIAHHPTLRVVALTDIGTTAVLGVVWAATVSPALGRLVVYVKRSFDQPDVQTA